MEEVFLLNSLKFTITVRNPTEILQLENLINCLIYDFKLQETVSNTKINYRIFSYLYDYNTILFYDKKLQKVVTSEQDINPYLHIGDRVFSVKVTQGKYYTFNIFNLSMFKQIEITKNKNTTQEMVDNILDLYNHKIYPDPTINDDKSKVYFSFLNQLLKYNLSQDAKYLSLGYKIQFEDTLDFEQYRLIEFFTKNKKGEFFRAYKFKKADFVYTVDIQYYKYNIYDIENFIKRCKEHLINVDDAIKKYNHRIPNLSEEERSKVKSILDDIPIDSSETILKKITEVLQIITGKQELEFRIDDKETYYIYSKEKLKQIFVSNGYLKFYPIIPNKSNYFKLEYSSHIGKEYGLSTGNRDEVKFVFKERLMCSFEINSWSSAKQNILSKYSSPKKHNFSFTDHSEDINENINRFLDKFKLIKISDKSILHKIDSGDFSDINTKVKFFKQIKQNKSIEEYTIPKIDWHLFY